MTTVAVETCFQPPFFIEDEKKKLVIGLPLLCLKNRYFQMNFNMYFYASTEYTVWKFQDFSITQILREINFGGSRSSKITMFAILGALNFEEKKFRVYELLKSLKLISRKI